jgi:NTE family protein
VHELLGQVSGDAGCADRWPDAPRPWIVAADYRTGRRVVFGRPRRQGAAPAGPPHEVALADAVLASCSIPGWYPPTLIGGVPHVDGGVLSNASVDVLIGQPLDEVFVLAPMGTRDTGRPHGAIGRVDRRIRRVITRRILSDAARLRASGARVSVIVPEADDLDAMGVNLMDPTRRLAVLETARRTATRQLAAQSRGAARVAGGASA